MKPLQPNSIHIPQDVYDRCEQWAHKVIDNLRRPRSLAESLSSGLSSHGIENNPVALRDSKCAECAFCFWAGLDLESLGWRTTDDGSDVLWRSLRFDIKQTAYDNGALIWPYRKRHLFRSKKFDALILVTGRDFDFVIARWTDKLQFELNHRIAGENHDRFTAGTMYMDQIDLWPIRTLVAAPDYESLRYDAVRKTNCF